MTTVEEVLLGIGEDQEAAVGRVAEEGQEAVDAREAVVDREAAAAVET